MKLSLLPVLCLSGVLLGGLLILPTVGAANPAGASKARKIDFDRDVRPILSENCFACHGPDANKRQAGLRLDTQEGAWMKRVSGSSAVAPSKPQESLLVRRVSATDGLKMPPESSGKKLTPKQIATLRQWVAEGGKYAPHWAFVPPQRPPIPVVQIQNPKSKIQNPIDAFVLARLSAEGLKPAPEADRVTLLRRVTFDLTGLPPTPAELDAFLADKSADAYEKVVDRLLASPHYGERMALKWLDLARYADTHGYHIDSGREMWRWRDWVIDAFNRNLPYDQFVVEQLAGDLLPNAGLDQKIATGFNRNHPINFEGGAIPEEYQTAYVMDRIDTTATTFMALTLRCGQCHDHKYDPLSQKDYYRFYAFFNNINEQGLDGQSGNAAPFLKAPMPGQQEQLVAYDKRLAELDQAMKARASETATAQTAWEKTAIVSLENAGLTNGLLAHYGLDEGKGDQIFPTQVGVNRSPTVLASTGQSIPHVSGGEIKPTGFIKGKSDWVQGKVGGALRFDGNTYVELGPVKDFERTDRFSYGAWAYPTDGGAAVVMSRMDDAANFRGWDLYIGDRRIYIHLINTWEQNAIRVNTKAQIELNKWTHLFVTYDGSSKAKGVRVYVNGKPLELDVTHDTLSGSIVTPKPAVIGRRTPGAPFKGLIDEARLYDRELTAAEVEQLVVFEGIRPILATTADKRTDPQKATLNKFYLENYDAPYRTLSTERETVAKQRTDLDKAIPTTMVMQEREMLRETHVLLRGQYDKPGEKVTMGTPGSLPPMPKDAPVNRLGLAKWLVDPQHPLTARVAVNRFWAMHFGNGIVRTAEDFGMQGERPSHPELLDWLATELVRTGWDMKAMQRLLVTSATYRQSSKMTSEMLEKDPDNRLLARYPRSRLPAEFVRDQALAVSGLLVDKIGGPSVKVYQPAGLWEDISFKGGFSEQYYVQDHGEKLYRRAMYTFWKRTLPPPSLQTFDAPEREFCIVRRSVTNTPLQALVLMNDPTYVEASRKFAEKIMTEAANAPNVRVEWAFRRVLGRAPKPIERTILMRLYNEQWTVFTKDTAAAQKLLSTGESPRNEKLDMAELAAWTMVASALFNLDEAITKN